MSATVTAAPHARGLRRTLLIMAGLLAIAGTIPTDAASAQQTQATSPEPDTTGPINRPIVSSIGPDTYFINEFGADSIFVVVGTRRALVIDTGSGFFDLKAAIANLTSVPYDVVVTHSHPDHAGGIGQFDTIYINPLDAPAALKDTYKQRVGYGHIMRNMSAAALGHSTGFANVWAYGDGDVRKWDRMPQVRPIADGQVFDLGGREVTAYHIPNHTPGSMVFIDDRSRILFSGDAANRNTGANVPVSTVLRGLLRLKALRTDYDRQFTGHTAYANMIEPLPQEPQILDDLIEDYRSILRGDPVLKVIPNHLFPDRQQTVAVHGQALVTFHPDMLWEPGEKHVVP